jgi:hypothetical protein
MQGRTTRRSVKGPSQCLAVDRHEFALGGPDQILHPRSKATSKFIGP